ncbi:MAG: AAA family ATPase [Bacteroidetes bacterium]|nr:AAA family ATPase [Bacteroidota bacterium]
MIDKFKKIKNLGIFEDYSWNASLTNFKRYNVIYGWNGSGKTTLSKLFDSLEKGIHPDYSTLEYEADCGAQKFKNGQPFDKKVRVFNQDYIQKNLKIIEGRANSITIVLGVENKELVEQIKKDQIELSGDSNTPGSTGKIQELKITKELLATQIKDKDKSFTDIARIIAASGGEAVRSYTSKQAKSSFVKLTQKELLTDTQLEHCALVLTQKSEPEILGIELPLVSLNESHKPEDIFQLLNLILSEAKSLLGQTVTSNIITRLKDNNDICDWVEAGIQLHKDHSSSNCEFCNQPLPADRMLQMSEHFNEEDKRLKDNIELLLSQLRRIHKTITDVAIIDRARFYEEFRTDFDTAASEFINQKKELLQKIVDIGNKIKEKKLNTTVVVDFSETINPTDFINALKEINNLITAHNLKISNLEKEKKDANQKLEAHHLSTIYDSVKLSETVTEGFELKITILQNGDPKTQSDIGISGLKVRIAENQAKISSTQKACDNINSGLATFLGRKELIFEPFYITTTVDGVEKRVEQGYIIKRNEVPVRNLSEGEKTAIAFVYFTVHLQDQEFELAKGVIVIDDPISSLDSNSLFQSFAFLKNAVKDAYQVFLLTHNYDFLRLLLNWVKNIPKKSGEKSYYMVNNSYSEEGIRLAFLAPLDKTLHEHESEYHYLFKCLYNFQSDGTILNVYHIPNIARKVLDTFLMFRVPNSDSGYKKLEVLTFDENKKTAIYKFTNDQSHITGSGFDPSLVIETQNNVKALLEMMEAVFPEHYKILVASIIPEIAAEA